MEGASRADILKACSEKNWTPARQIKESLRSRYPDQEKLSPEAQQVFDKLAPIWVTYADAGNVKKGGFAKDDIYYDAKANPCHHLKAFYLICCLLEDNKAKLMQCFPLCTSWIYSHMHVDSTILWQQVIGKAPKDCADPWSELVDLTKHPFKSCGEHFFAKSADTDG
ncbi:hypothetical protein GGI07_005836, partial [Coemansia sp. Benny D115]